MRFPPSIILASGPEHKPHRQPHLRSRVAGHRSDTVGAERCNAPVSALQVPRGEHREESIACGSAVDCFPSGTFPRVLGKSGTGASLARAGPGRLPSQGVLGRGARAVDALPDRGIMTSTSIAALPPGALTRVLDSRRISDWRGGSSMRRVGRNMLHVRYGLATGGSYA